MHIQEIILEGFKSYATRTVITGWDAEFNAITGLNGSGKSNILDAICFVLGIENLRQVRATSLQDLVYKRGQAGITKASVSIVFNNEDVARSPVGYAEHKQITVTRQVIVGGKNKYLINGHNAAPKVVENLFQSVQLNINNPHFLIMQGQITKVLNMKPPEILAMLEETAGTRMFEDRKLKALQTMGKKEKKVDEIEGLLTDVIGPKLDALRKEKAEYVEFKRTEGEIEKLAKFIAAFDYHHISLAKAKNESELASSKEELNSLEMEVKTQKLELEAVAEKISVVSKKKEKESKASNKLKDLESLLKDAEHETVKLQTQVTISKESLDEETADISRLSEKLSADEARAVKEKSAFEALKQNVEEKENVLKTLRENVEREEELLRSLSTGISSDGQATGYDRLAKEAQNKLSETLIRVQQSELKMKTLEESIASMKEDVSRARKESTGAGKKIELVKAEIESISAEKSAVSFDVSQEKALEEERRRLEGQLSSLKERLDQLKSVATSIGFSYTDPYPGFDRSLVKGVVAELVNISPENMKFAQALEVAAGGRLYNVVVQDEKVAGSLLEKGRLQRRVTIIPLTKIQARPVTAEKARLGSELTGGKAVVGLSLVTCADDVHEAIKFVFGGAFICQDKEAATKIAFDGRIGAKAVTVEGDVYEPSGTLSGGSAPSSGSILTKLCEYAQCKENYDNLSSDLDVKKNQLEVLRAARRKHSALEQRHDQKVHELTLLERQLSQNASGRLILQYEAMLADMTTLNQTISEALEEKGKAERDLASLAQEKSELATNRDGKLKKLEKDLTASKKKLAEETKSFEIVSARYLKIKTEVELLAETTISCRAELEEKMTCLEKAEEHLAQLQSSYYEQQSKTVGLRVKYETEVQHIRQFDEELKMLEMNRQELVEAIENAAIEKKRLHSAVTALIDSVSKDDRQMQALVSRHPWIKDQKQHFGVSGGPYDFAGKSVAETRKVLSSLEEQHSRLRKNINFNVMDMIDRVEAKEVALKQMLTTVKKDRKTIEQTITKLNDYKLETLEKTFTKVNTDFGLIFADLLPGSFARLEPLPDQPITEGLEIRVQLGGVWKQGLAELSGGQRSVIALSLILSLLQYRPAPMYILDEVDAALDLSHTENIGRLFQTRFKGSQFIVVSLKEGMFANANVLFKTRFRDGISSVERTENRTHNKNAKSIKEAASKRAGISLPKTQQSTRLRT